MKTLLAITSCFILMSFVPDTEELKKLRVVPYNKAKQAEIETVEEKCYEWGIYPFAHHYSSLDIKKYDVYYESL